ncbi:hypothetical protein GCM10011609_25180 [Lentzea pudingi]|uniref:Uncharacterized protein n=1 Tax=Lentzea pudingi TaxID=1789439 RepID=A0ABQ2HP12_9PSEU|nr:hypothetical protein GCM10011609_25180 [Lentzea pudingi]
MGSLRQGGARGTGFARDHTQPDSGNPEYTVEGRLRLRQKWERFGPNASAVISYLDQVG